MFREDGQRSNETRKKRNIVTLMTVHPIKMRNEKQKDNHVDVQAEEIIRNTVNARIPGLTQD